MKLVSAQRMARIDREAQEQYHIPGIVLMEDAALRCVDLLLNEMAEESSAGGSAAPVMFIAGKGNNGGDALAMARLCRTIADIDVRVVVTGDSPTGLCGQQLQACKALGIPITMFDGDIALIQREISNASWIVDGISGTGINGPLRDPIAVLVNALNESMKPVFAVDTPSGIGDEFRQGFPAVRARVTATVGLPKSCLYLPYARPLCGKIVPVPISFPGALTAAEDISGELLQPESLLTLLPPIDPWTYKTKRGFLAVFAGSRGTAGAAVLASTAAAHSRTGLVSLFIDEEAHASAAAQCTSVMVRPWGKAAHGVNEVLPGPYTALAVGPGWGTGADRPELLDSLVGSGLPGVLDADGLNSLGWLKRSGGTIPRFNRRWVFTPHPGEFSRLFGMETASVLADPFSAATAAAVELDVYIVLKGHVTTIAAPDGRFWLVDGMNPAMATGGSGDVLTGIIGGLLASGLSPEAAAKAGVLLHQEAGKEAFLRRGWFVADDLIGALSTVLSRYQKKGE